METSGNRTLIIVIVAAVALLIGCCCGILIGSFGASLIGIRSATISDSRDFMPELNAVPAPRLRVTPEPALPEQSERRAVPEEAPTGLAGAYVRDVGTDSPADRAGIEAGDFIIAVDDQVLDAEHRLADVLAEYEPGDSITLRVLRAGSNEPEEVTVRLAENDAAPGKAYLGVWFMDVTPRE